MTEHEAERQRIISIVEDIEHVDAIVSSLDYEISVASEEERSNLKDQFSRFQGQSNNMVNYLKAEGYTLKWDGSIIYVDKDEKPWMYKSIHGEWLETFAIPAKPDDHSEELSDSELERLSRLAEPRTPLQAEQAATTEALQVFTRFLDLLKNSPDETLELFKLVTSINHPAFANPDMAISGIVATCCICGYVETMQIPEEARTVDILAAMEELKGNCSQCEEDRRLASIEQEEEYPDAELIARMVAVNEAKLEEAREDQQFLDSMRDSD